MYLLTEWTINVWNSIIDVKNKLQRIRKDRVLSINTLAQNRKIYVQSNRLVGLAHWLLY